MANKVERFTKAILEQPQLISLDRFKEISEYLDTRNSDAYDKALEKASLLGNDESFVKRGLVEGSIGFLNVHGSLVDKKSPLNALCGMTAYRQLLEDMDYICSFEEVDTVVMDVSSGGGLAFNMANTSTQLRNKAEKNGKKLVAYIDEQSCSAAYGLTSSAHEIVAHPDASVGSIGVLFQLRNPADGEPAPIFVTAGKDKIPFDKEGNYSEAFLEDLQAKVDETYENFVNLVATQRNLPVETIKGTEAKVFKSNKALELGLVDKIMSPEEFNDYLADMTSGEQTNSPQQTGNSLKIAAKTNVAETQLTIIGDEEMTPEQQAKLEQFDAMQAKLAALETAQTQAKASAIKESLSAYTFLSNEVQASLSEIILAGGEQASLINTVLEQANAGIDAAVGTVKAANQEAIEKLSNEVQEANEKLATKDSEIRSVKEEFGKQESLEGEVDKTKLTVSDEASRLAAKVAKKLQQK